MSVMRVAAPPRCVEMFPPSSKKKQVLNQRCMRAEDEKWDQYIIPTLRAKCIQCLVDNFVDLRIIDELNEKDRESLVGLLPTQIPLTIQAENIPEESYWKRCCQDNGEVIIIQFYDYSWKRAFFERYAQRCIQRFHPDVDNVDELLDELKICKPFVKQLRIEQMWQKPQREVATLYFYPYEQSAEAEEEEDRDNPLMPPDDCQCLQLTQVLSVLSEVTELDLSFSAKECSDEFDWKLFELTEKDCEDLGKALKERPVVTVFKLRRSRIDDQKALIIMYALLDHPKLKVLDFSHNRIGDLGAKAIAKLIKSLYVLEDFNIMNNLIGGNGFEFLAYSVASHPSIKTVNISMNRPTDIGGTVFCRALAQNSVLQSCVLNANGFGAETSKALGEMLRINSTLLSLSLANNPLGEEGGEPLLVGLQQNCVILSLDVRMCRLGERYEYEITRKLKYNKHRDEKNYVLPQPYSSTTSHMGSSDTTPRDVRLRVSIAETKSHSRGSVTSRTSATRKSSAISSRSTTSKKSVRSLKSIISKVTSKIS